MDMEDVQCTRLKAELIHFKNTLRRSINAAKRLYYLRTFALYRNDIKQTWSVIKDTLQKKLHSAPSNKFILIQFNSYVYFRHKKSIYNKIYIQLDKIYIRIYNNAIRSIRTKKGDFKENIFIMLQCRTTNSKCLRRLEPRSHK